MTAATWEMATGDDGRTVVRLRGDVDVAIEQPFLADIETVSDGEQLVELDCSAVTFMDSTGVRVLMSLRSGLGERFVLGEVSRPVEHLLDMAGVLDHLTGGGHRSGASSEQADHE